MRPRPAVPLTVHVGDPRFPPSTRFPVFATRLSRTSPARLSPFLTSLHSTPFFSKDCELFFTTAASQPFAYQSLPHSFHRHGGGIPSLASSFPFSTLPVLPNSFACHRSEKATVKSNDSYTSKTAFRKSFHCHTSEIPLGPLSLLKLLLVLNFQRLTSAFSRSSALVCTHQKVILFFQAIPNAFAKTPGMEYPSILTFSASLLRRGSRKVYPFSRWPELANRPGLLFQRSIQVSTVDCQPPLRRSSTGHGTRLTATGRGARNSGHVPVGPRSKTKAQSSRVGRVFRTSAALGR